MPVSSPAAWKWAAENTKGDKVRSARSGAEYAMEDADGRRRAHRDPGRRAKLASTHLPASRVQVLRLDVGDWPDMVRIGLVITDLPFDHRAGAVAVEGPNGSGKTTPLSLVTGGSRCWAGTVAVPVDLAALTRASARSTGQASIAENFRSSQSWCERECPAARRWRGSCSGPMPFSRFRR